jgi:hypothetical protein
MLDHSHSHGGHDEHDHAKHDCAHDHAVRYTETISVSLNILRWVFSL